jgi:hypothetical protein
MTDELVDPLITLIALLFYCVVFILLVVNPCIIIDCVVTIALIFVILTIVGS